jgi:hypothetical protein
MAGRLAGSIRIEARLICLESCSEPAFELKRYIALGKQTWRAAQMINQDMGPVCETIAHI